MLPPTILLSNLPIYILIYHRCFTVISQILHRDYLLKTIGFTLYIMIWNAYYRMEFNERLRLALEKRLEEMGLTK